MDSPEQVLKALSAVGCDAQDASRNAYVVIKDENPSGEFPRIDNASIEASLVEATDASPPWAKQARFTVDGV